MNYFCADISKYIDAFNIALSLNLTSKKDIVYIDSIQFKQVLLNIVKNNGPSISEKVKQKLFTPFFITKSSDKVLD